jgi:hypothetical protein
MQTAAKGQVQQAISRDSNEISGGLSNANSGGRSNESDTQQAIVQNSNADSGGGSNANSGGRSNGSDTSLAISRDPNANSGGDSNANSGGESNAVDTQRAISQDLNAISGGDPNANSGGQSATNTSVPAASEEREPRAGMTTRKTVVDNMRYTRDAIVHQSDRYEEAAARVVSRQRVIYLQSLLDENREDRLPTQRSIDDQQLIDGLQRQLFTKQGECSTLESDARQLQSENERQLTETRTHYRDV